MTAATVDRLLAVLVVAMAATGLATLRVGTPAGAWLFVLHGLIAGALALALAIKLGQSVPRAARSRRWGRLALGLFVALVAIAALSGGFVWVASGELLSLRGWTILTLHAWAGLVLVPLVLIHLLPRRWRLLRPGRRPGARPAAAEGPAAGPRSPSEGRLSRRTVLAGAALGAAGVGAWATTGILDRLRGGQRRFTGSRALPAGGIPPPTTFFGEPAPPIDVADWRLTVDGRVGRALSLDRYRLAELGTTTRVATLDCTSGWAMETDWAGTPLSTILDEAGVAHDVRSVTVRSATGWSAVLPLVEARGCLLATHVAGEPLPIGNGHPCRLVVPGRRGLDWVKWVVEIEVA